MSNAQIAVLAGAAILVFWMVGAYNRLVALRSAIGSAWLLVDEVLKKRGDAVRTLVAALREPLAGEQGALDALLAAEKQLRRAADALGARPLVAALASALVGVEPTLASAASRVLALLDQHAELRHHDDIAPAAAVLRDTEARLAFTRQLFNEAALAYDRAVQQFPTNLLARIYRFGRPAGCSRLRPGRRWPPWPPVLEQRHRHLARDRIRVERGRLRILQQQRRVQARHVHLAHRPAGEAALADLLVAEQFHLRCGAGPAAMRL